MKNAKQYSALIAEGYSEKAAARITNTPTKEGSPLQYEEHSKKELYELAQKLDIEGRSEMNKSGLVKALRQI